MSSIWFGIGFIVLWMGTSLLMSNSPGVRSVLFNMSFLTFPLEKRHWGMAVGAVVTLIGAAIWFFLAR